MVFWNMFWGSFFIPPEGTWEFAAILHFIFLFGWYLNNVKSVLVHVHTRNKIFIKCFTHTQSAREVLKCCGIERAVYTLYTCSMGFLSIEHMICRFNSATIPNSMRFFSFHFIAKTVTDDRRKKRSTKNDMCVNIERNIYGI